MITASTDPWKAVAGQLRLKAIWCAITAYWFGGYLGAAMWRPRDVYYPFPLILWGFFTVLFWYATVRYFNQLSWAVPTEEARLRKAKVRPLVAYFLGITFNCFCLALCAVAIKSFGKLYAVGAVVLGISMILMILITERKIKKLAHWLSQPHAESIT
jgi:hypothetical protein